MAGAWCSCLPQVSGFSMPSMLRACHIPAQGGPAVGATAREPAEEGDEDEEVAHAHQQPRRRCAV